MKSRRMMIACGTTVLSVVQFSGMTQSRAGVPQTGTIENCALRIPVVRDELRDTVQSATKAAAERSFRMAEIAMRSGSQRACMADLDRVTMTLNPVTDESGSGSPLRNGPP